jgi:DNA-binding transcriptional ArsR family regulator
MTTPEPDPEFFRKRGILDHIWQARTYVFWTPENPEPARESFSDLNAAQRAHIARMTSQAPGWAITRHVPPLNPPLPTIYPELRPLKAVKIGGPKTHWHGDDDPPTNFTVIYPGSEKFYEEMPDWMRLPGNRESWRGHIERCKKKDGTYKDCDAEDHHHGENTEAAHWHQKKAKYVFAPTALMDGARVHDHVGMKPAMLTAHLAKQHGGVDVEGQHAYEYRTKDLMAPAMARRLDVHPLAVNKILRAEVVFFVIEGCLKADAVLSADGAVFSVPSVSLWDAHHDAELRRFAFQYLEGKQVVIVPDADWSGNPLVLNQARMCQITLRRMGIMSYVAAPPEHLGDEDTKGVDDFLAAGGGLEDLLAIGGESIHHLSDWVRDHANTTRRDVLWRLEQIIFHLSIYAGDEGIVTPTIRTLGRVMGVPWSTLSDHLHRLRDVGAIRYTGSLETRRNWWTGLDDDDWKDKPHIELIEELRTEIPEKKPLGEVLGTLLPDAQQVDVDHIYTR